MKLSGHFALFNRWTEINNRAEGRFMEQVAPGAFARTLREDRERMRMLFNHGADPTLGAMILGAIEDVREDARGAAYEAELFEGLPPMLVEGLKAGEYGSSFRFKSVREQYVHRPGRSAHNPAGIPETTLLETRVIEFGPVSFPAYREATAFARSRDDVRLGPISGGRISVLHDEGRLGSGPTPRTFRRLQLEARTSRTAAELVRALELGGTVELTWDEHPTDGLRSGRVLRSSRSYLPRTTRRSYLLPATRTTRTYRLGRSAWAL